MRRWRSEASATAARRRPCAPRSSDADPASGKAAAYALGALADPSSADALREVLHDDQIDVTWNAAVALARMNDPSGAEVLRSMADREFVERASLSEDPGSRADVLVTAVQAIAMIEGQGIDPGAREAGGPGSGHASPPGGDQGARDAAAEERGVAQRARPAPRAHPVTGCARLDKQDVPRTCRRLVQKGTRTRRCAAKWEDGARALFEGGFRSGRAGAPENQWTR
jgi:hypothetical protein